MKSMMNRPGVSLLVVGALLLFLVRPLVAKLWVVGGILGPLAFGIGLLGIVGGLYLLARSTMGPGA